MVLHCLQYPLFAITLLESFPEEMAVREENDIIWRETYKGKAHNSSIS